MSHEFPFAQSLNERCFRPGPQALGDLTVRVTLRPPSIFVRNLLPTAACLASPGLRMAKTKAPPLSPCPRHIAKQAPAKAKTYSTSHIFKKKPQKAPDAHGRGNVIWADKLGRNWLRKVEQKEREKQKNAQEMHPLASEFNGIFLYNASLGEVH